jgi:hypothetical protein
VVVPSLRRSLKVLPFMEVSIIFSEKVAVTSIVGTTSVLLALRMVLTTLGGSVSEGVMASRSELHTSVRRRQQRRATVGKKKRG